MTRAWLLAVCAFIAGPAFAEDTDGDGCDDAWVDGCVHPTATVDPSVTVASGASIGAGATVGPAVALAAGAVIAPKASLLGRNDGAASQPVGTLSLIGRRTSFGADATVGANNIISRAVVAGEDLTTEGTVTVGYAASMGDRVTLRAGATVANLAILGHDVTLGAGARLGRGSEVGAGADVLGKVGPGVMIGAGADIAATASVRRGAEVGAFANVLEGAVVGRGAELQDGATLGMGAAIRAGGTVLAGVGVPDLYVVGRGETYGGPGSIVGTTHTVLLAGTVPMALRGVPGGTYTMGCLVGRDDVEGQDCTQFYMGAGAHQVTLTHDFWVQTTEVTQDQFAAITGANPSFWSACGGDCPVEKVSWHDAAWFANAVSAQEGLASCYACTGSTWNTSDCTVQGDPYTCAGYRMPTEAEWEYACRGNEDFPFPGSDNALTVAWHSANAGGTPHRVAQLAANAFGTYDMGGNVYEWTNEWARLGPYATDPVTDPPGPASDPGGSRRIYRGANYPNDARRVRCADMDFGPVGQRATSVGFRLVRTVP